MDRKKRIAGIASVALLLIAAILIANTYISKTGKIDDWQFTAQAYGGFSISNLFAQFPFQNFWYAYLIAAAIAALYVLPLIIFFQGVWIFFRNFRDKPQRSRGTHKIALGLPMAALVFGIGFLFAASAIDQYFDYSFTDYLNIGAQIVFLIPIIIALLLGIRGIYVWIRYRMQAEMRKRGRKKTVFSFYQLLFLSLPFVLLFIQSSLTTSVMAPSPSPYGLPAATSASPSFGSGVQLFSNVGAPRAVSADSIGLSVGGAKDINNFRENIKNKYLPIPTDITHEGLFYDYLFDTGIQEPCEKLFCPSYTTAISKDPFSRKDEYFLSVGLNSGIQQKDFARKKLNLMIVLDISGSMDSAFDEYYYDRFRDSTSTPLTREEEQDARKSKMEVAKKSINALLGHLNADDSVGMVLFDDVSYLAKPLRKIEETDIESIKNHISDLQPQGGTNMSAGMQAAKEQFASYEGVNAAEYENRIIFLTDAMPNTGDTSEGGMMGMARSLADKKIYTTFIGIGVDFNTELVDAITKIRGANYYAVHSASEFKKRMDTNFDYMVTPLVFNLALTLQAPGYQIEKVYGSPEAQEATGEIMKINTLFPSERTEEETRGGLVILHLKKVSDDPSITLTTSYEGREGAKDGATASVLFKGTNEYFDASGIRKGILLARYANLIRDWISFERASSPAEERKVERPIPPVDYYASEGIPVLPPEFVLGKWERQSMPLVVSTDYKKIFSDFTTYYESERTVLGDETLKKESDVLNFLLGYQP